MNQDYLHIAINFHLMTAMEALKNMKMEDGKMKAITHLLCTAGQVINSKCNVEVVEVNTNAK